MEEHSYVSVKQMQGSMSHAHCEKPDLYERAQYIKIIQSYNAKLKTSKGIEATSD